MRFGKITMIILFFTLPGQRLKRKYALIISVALLQSHIVSLSSITNHFLPTSSLSHMKQYTRSANRHHHHLQLCFISIPVNKPNYYYFLASSQADYFVELLKLDSKTVTFCPIITDNQLQLYTIKKEIQIKSVRQKAIKFCFSFFFRFVFIIIFCNFQLYIQW